MALDDQQVKWLERIVGAADATADAGPLLAARTDALEKYNQKLDPLRGDLKAASADLTISWPEPEVRRFWDFSKKKEEMKWMTGDAEVEADTVHDLVDKFMVDTEKAAKLQKLHEQVVQIQDQMAAEKGPDGKPLFSTDDIRRELWSPLVQAGIIPSNAVSDKFSQDAVVFNGACELYKTKLEDHTKTASRHEDAQRVLRIVGAGLSMAGSMVKGGLELGAMNATDISTKEVMDNEKNLRDIALAKEHGASATEIADLQGKIDAFNAHKETAKVAAAQLKEQVALVTLATGVVQGGLSIADGALDRPDEKKVWKVAETAWGAIGTTAGDAFGQWVATVSASGSDEASTAAFKTLATEGAAIIKGALAGGKLVFRVHDAVAAKKDADRVAAVKSCILGLADVFFYAISAADKQSGKGPDGTTLPGTDGKFAVIAAEVKVAIVATADAGEIAAQLKKAYDEDGKLPTGGALAKLIGVTALDGISVASVLSLAAVEDAVRTSTPSISEQQSAGIATDDLSVKPQNAFTESEAAAAKRKAGDGAAMGKDLDSAAAFSKLLDWPDGSAEDKARAIAELQLKQEAADKKDAIEDLRDRLKTDEAFREEFVKTLKGESDKAIADVLKATEDAMPPADALADDPDAAKKAMAAVDKLIAEAAACNAKWKIMTGIAKGGTSVLVAALPVAGLASSITQLATDIAILVRKSYHVNKWRQNMALTYGNSSVYGPSIQRQLDSCIVQVSQQTVRTILDMVGVAADALKLADLSGVGGAVGAVGHGMQAANTMAQALTEFGFKMHREAEIEIGWQRYKTALENPGDRKAARSAMKWNTTLGKCVIAYGIVIDKDPIAKEVGRSCGLTPEVLADQKDVCPKVVKYFETLYSDDPVVLRRSPAKKKWHPGKPVLTLDSWLRFKAAAAKEASPPLAERSLQTAAIDNGLAVLAAAIGSDGDYAAQRDKQFPYSDDLLSGLERSKPAYRTFLVATETAAKALKRALDSYHPVNAPPKPGEDWKDGDTHAEMLAVTASLATQCDDILGAVRFDLQEYEALVAVQEDPGYDADDESDLLAEVEAEEKEQHDAAQ